MRVTACSFVCMYTTRYAVSSIMLSFNKIHTKIHTDVLLVVFITRELYGDVYHFLWSTFQRKLFADMYYDVSK